MTDTFTRAFAVVIGEEGGYTTDRADTGNWTGGAVGAGELRGTKFGISAAAYPTLDIAALTLPDAQAIYRRDYWDRVRGDDLPAPLALIVFDAAVNNGVGRAARWLQGALGVAEDGDIGPVTLAAVKAQDGNASCVEFLSQRLVFMVSLETWPIFGLGWSRRLMGLPFKAVSFTGATP